MMRPPDPRFERFLDLACDAELVGLSPAEEAELAGLGHAYGPMAAIERQMIERAVAGIAIAGASRGLGMPLPPHLVAQLAQLARLARLEQSVLAPAPAPSLRASNVVPFAPAPRRPSQAPLVASWIVAAACLLLAVGFGVRKPKEVVVTKTVEVPITSAASAPPTPSETAAPSPTEARTALLARADTENAPWSRTKDSAAKETDGDVVWNAGLQQGFMRFRGLLANDPKSWQYQLWIFDATGDARYPVDGGVFDVDPTTGDVVVPIHAKIAVGKATMFAVTVEKPGGVVVSKRKRIVVTAKLAT
jgi:hypothetical protein